MEVVGQGLCRAGRQVSFTAARRVRGAERERTTHHAGCTTHHRGTGHGRGASLVFAQGGVDDFADTAVAQGVVRQRVRQARLLLARGGVGPRPVEDGDVDLLARSQRHRIQDLPQPVPGRQPANGVGDQVGHQHGCVVVETGARTGGCRGRGPEAGCRAGGARHGLAQSDPAHPAHELAYVRYLAGLVALNGDVRWQQGLAAIFSHQNGGQVGEGGRRQGPVHERGRLHGGVGAGGQLEE